MQHIVPFAKKKLVQALVLGAGFAIAATAAHANTGTEFQTGSTNFSNWLTGYYGKMAAFAATALGIGIAALTKQFIPTLMGIGIGVIVPVCVSVINASFGAILA